MSFTYNADSLLTGVQLSSGVTETATYNGAGQVGLQSLGGGASGAIGSYQYGYDGAGLTGGTTSTVGLSSPTTLSLTHDMAGHLVGSSGTCTGTCWTYDGNDNLQTATSAGATTTYTDPAGPQTGDELVTVGSASQVTNYGYDSNGNTQMVMSRAGSSGLLQSGEVLSYDAEGRLASVSGISGLVVSQAYGADGLRSSYSVTPVGATTPLTNEQFLYDGGQLTQMALSVNGTVAYTDTYVYTQAGAPLELLRTQASTGTTSRYWYLLDGRGSVVALVDQSGNVVDRYAYDLWGVPTYVSDSVPQQLRYDGYWYDTETGWYWLRIRAYDPVLKRFLQPDPSGQDGQFSYAYCSDDPVDHSDPTGLTAEQFSWLPTNTGWIPYVRDQKAEGGWGPWRQEGAAFEGADQSGGPAADGTYSYGGDTIAALNGGMVVCGADCSVDVPGGACPQFVAPNHNYDFAGADYSGEGRPAVTCGTSVGDWYCDPQQGVARYLFQGPDGSTDSGPLYQMSDGKIKSTWIPQTTAVVTDYYYKQYQGQYIGPGTSSAPPRGSMPCGQIAGGWGGLLVVGHTALAFLQTMAAIEEAAETGDTTAVGEAAQTWTEVAGEVTDCSAD